MKTKIRKLLNIVCRFVNIVTYLIGFFTVIMLTVAIFNISDIYSMIGVTMIDVFILGLLITNYKSFIHGGVSSSSFYTASQYRTIRVFESILTINGGIGLAIYLANQSHIEERFGLTMGLLAILSISLGLADLLVLGLYKFLENLINKSKQKEE